MDVGVGAPLQLHHVVEVEEDDVDAFSEEELARRLEVRVINRYAVLRTYMLMGLKGTGALVVLWATVVLLGGFVSKLEKKDFWYITYIAFVQAGGMFNAMFDNELRPLMSWFLSTMKKLILPSSSRVKHDHVDTQLHQTCWSYWTWWLKTIIKSMLCRGTDLIVSVVLYLVLSFFLYSPLICAGLSYWRIGELDYGSRSKSNKDDTEPNLIPGIYLFYYLCVAQGILFLFIVLPVETYGTQIVVNKVRHQLGLSWEVVLGYCNKTKLKYLKNPESSDESWNLITYGAASLDSEMPEDYASGARVLTRLIQQGVPVRRLLLRSPGRRIQKLVATLAWRSPAEVETRWLAAMIVEHVAPDLSLAQFPGALECISCLLDTSCYNKDDGAQEAIYFAAQLRLDKEQSEQKKMSLGSRLRKRIKHLLTLGNGNAQEKEQLISSMDSAKGTNEDLILQGLRILENLAVDELNCKVICSSDALFSKITAPLNSENLILEDLDTNTAWAKVIDGSLKLLSRLMNSPGDTGKEMHRKVAENKTAVENLEKFLVQKVNSFNIVVLQIRAIDILAQLCSGDESTSSNNNLASERREFLIPKVQDIFLTDKWMMKDYLSKTRENLEEEIEKSNKSKKSKQQARQALVENLKAAQETVSHLKEKAGEALATLCVGNQIRADDIRGFTCTGPQNILRYLTQMLDSDSEGSTVRCRICAAVILKHLCTHCTRSPLDEGYLKETTLNTVLSELLDIKAAAQTKNSSKLIQWWKHTICHNERLCVQQGHKQQHEERRLQVALLSLCAAIRGRWISGPEFATVVAQLASPKELAEKLKKLVEENRYATPSCRATVKLTCELVIALIQYDHSVEEVKMKKVVVDSLYQASKTMAGLESCMLFAGTERDCYGIPVKPLCSVLVEEAQDLLRRKGQALGLTIIV